MKRIEELKAKEAVLQAKLRKIKSEIISVQKALIECELKDVKGKIFSHKRYGKCKIVNIQHGYIQLKRIKVDGKDFKVLTSTAYKLDRFLEEAKEV